jgi:hypothetical protein
VILSKDYKDTISNAVDEITQISKYYWDENNLIRIEDFSKDMELELEWTYKYDKKHRSSAKIASIYPLTSSQNTQISFSVKGSKTALISIYVPSKITMLCYNTDGFLTKVEREKGGETYFYRNP